MAEKNDRGAALIIVLLMVTLLVAITLEMSRASRSEYYESANLRDRLKTLYLAKSGFYRAEAALMEDDNNYDGLFEKWAKPQVLSAQSGTLFEDGYFDLVIEDESGRIPINRLVVDGNYYMPVKDVLTNLLAQPDFKLEAQQINRIVSAIKDYMDLDSALTDPEARPGTAEAPGASQGGQEPPYYKNASLDSLDELLNIKEITPELFYGTADRPGLSKYLTIFGERININTAPRPVLKALSAAMTDEMAGRMEDFRKNDSKDLADPGWYRKIPGLSGVNIPPDLIVVRSRIFRITATGTLGPQSAASMSAGGQASRSGFMSSVVTGVVERREVSAQQNASTQAPIRVLSWKVD